MNGSYSSRPAETLQRIIIARLSFLGGEAFLYGSSAAAFQAGHDIDLLFVLDGKHHDRVYREIAVIQEDCPLPLHPTVVAPLLSASGVRLW